MDTSSILAINAVKGIQATASRGEGSSTAASLNKAMEYMSQPPYTVEDSTIELPIRGGSPRQRERKPPRHKTKIGRNEQCPCGSGKKFKRCHLAKVKGEE